MLAKQLTRRLEPLESEDENGGDGLARNLAMTVDVGIFQAQLDGLVCGRDEISSALLDRVEQVKGPPLPESLPCPAPLLLALLLAVTVARRSLRRTMTALCI